MVLVFFAIGAVLVVAIAFVALGQVIGRLEHERRPAVYQMVEAVSWIADRLPDELTARLSYSDVEQVLLWHLDWFGDVGVSSRHGEELAGDKPVREGAVAVEEAAVDAVVARALNERPSSRAPIEAVDVVCILDLQMQYLAAIGAVGAEVQSDDRGPGE